MQKIFDLCTRTAESTWFQATIIAAIVAAGILVGIQTYVATSSGVRSTMGLLDAIDLFILIVFTIEVVVKVLAEGSEEENIKKKEADDVSVEDGLHAITAKLDALQTEMDFVHKRMLHANGKANATTAPAEDTDGGAHL